jgi:hypothetical protein
LVPGPGDIGDQLSKGLRDRVLPWLRATPDSGLGEGTLGDRIPRLPFPLVVRISAASAGALAASLASLGLTAEARSGGRLAHGGMLEKMFRIGARRSKVALPFAIIAFPIVLFLFVLLLPLLPVYLGIVAWWTSRPALEDHGLVRHPGAKTCRGNEDQESRHAGRKSAAARGSGSIGHESD